MKKKTDYSKWTTEQLEKQLKTLKFVTGLLAGILIALFGFTAYVSFRDSEFNPLLVTPLALSVIIPVNWQRMKEMSHEIQTRKENN